jgi:membrane-associated phospholipid phosphatase
MATTLDPAPLATRRARRILVAIATTSAVLFVAVYAFAVHTRWGQRLDAAALKGRGVLSKHDVHVAARLHTSIDIASLAFLGGAIILVALWRGRLYLALGAATIIAGSVTTSEFLKHTLSRPELGVNDALRHLPSYPSGHTTIAMSLSISAIFVAPRRFRAPVAALGALFSAAMGCSLVATASHRPSDTIGAVLVVTVWSAVVAALLLRTDPTEPTGPSTPAKRSALLSFSPWMALGGVALLVGSFTAAAIGIIAVHYGAVDTVPFGRAFVAAGGAIIGTVLICTAALLLALQNSDLGPFELPRRWASRP